MSTPLAEQPVVTEPSSATAAFSLAADASSYITVDTDP